MGNEQSHSFPTATPIVNDISVEWKAILANGISNPLIGCEGHSAASTKDGVHFIFGGLVKTNNELTETNCLYKHDPKGDNIAKVSSTGSVPNARAYSCIVAVDNILYVLGGFNKTEGWLDDVHAFDTGTSIWTKVECYGDYPPPRDKSAAVAVGNKIYLFGGFGPADTSKLDSPVHFEESEDDEFEDMDEEGEKPFANFMWFNDLYELNTENKSWRKILGGSDGTGPGPTPRAAHSLSNVQDKYLVVFGGKDSSGRQNDVHVFDLEKNGWVSGVQILGKPPTGRSFHSAATVGQRVVIFGGRDSFDQHHADLHILDFANFVAPKCLAGEGEAPHQLLWLQPSVHGAEQDRPSARGSCAMSASEVEVLVCGGSDGFLPDSMTCERRYADAYAIAAEDITRGSGTVKKEDKENSSSVANTDQEEPSASKTDCTETEIATNANSENANSV